MTKYPVTPLFIPKPRGWLAQRHVTTLPTSAVNNQIQVSTCLPPPSSSPQLTMLKTSKHTKCSKKQQMTSEK